MHRLLGALARKDYEDALLALRAPEGEPGAWTADRIAAAMAPYYQEHRTLDTTPAARHPSNTIIRPDGDRLWRVQQRLFDRTGEEDADDWAIHTTVDLTTGVPGDGPLIELERIGV
jgi:hypothetical protein